MTRISIICPKCKSQYPYEITSRSEHNFRCTRCHQVFRSRIVKIRAKRSRGSRKENKRRFLVRYYDLSGSEGMIEFDITGYEDFELRARDIAVFSYVKDKLTLIQNCTVNRYLRISNPYCFLATCLYGPASEEVAVLKRFRDNILLDSALLSRFVALYYHLSPLAVRWLGDKRFFKEELIGFKKAASFLR